MSFEMFVRLLQSLITMADSPENVEKAFKILDMLDDMCETTNKVDGRTAYAIHVAADSFDILVAQRNEFAGIPGDVNNNKKKRHRLAMYLMPGC